MSNQHARLGPSNHRWPHCPGSVREEAAYPDIAGESAIDGTGSHLLLEMCLKNGVRAETYAGHIIGIGEDIEHPDGWPIYEDRILRVQMCLDYVSSRYAELGKLYPGYRVVLESESKSDPGGMFGRSDWWGTCDITLLVINRHNCCVFAEVIDYKDGRGWVDVKNNTQLISYLGGKLRPFIVSDSLFTPDRVTNACMMTIVQPKTNPVVRHVEITTQDLVDELKRLNSAAIATDAPDAPLIPDDQGGKGYCRWCKHKSNCVALSQLSIEKVNNMSALIPTQAIPNSTNLFELSNQLLADVTTFPSHMLVELVDAEPGVMQVFDKARAEIERRIVAGEIVNGFAMTPGSSRNVWALSEEEIVKALKGRRLKMDEIYPKTLISPAQVVKLKSLNKDQIERIKKELIVTKVGDNKLTRVSKDQKQEADTRLMFADVPVVDFMNAPPEPKVSFY